MSKGGCARRGREERRDEAEKEGRELERVLTNVLQQAIRIDTNLKDHKEKKKREGKKR